jgi:hypothetical protein
MSSNLILKMIEKAVARNLLDYVQAAQTVCPQGGAAAAGCAGGTAAFLGPGSPLTTVKGAGPEITDDEIEKTERFFRRCSSDSVRFELAPWISSRTVQRFRQRGYEVAGSEDVVVYRPPFTAPVPCYSVVPVDANDWPELMLRMNESPDLAEWRPVVAASAVLPKVIRLGVRDDKGVLIACAQIQPAAGVGLFGNDATLSSARGRGAQTAAIQERLRKADKFGFSCVAAEVAPGSTSERNYLRCGFQLAYTRAYYARHID